MARRIAGPASLAGLLVLASCAHAPGTFIWAESFAAPAAPGEQGYVIAVGDQLTVRVYREEALSGRVRVRADGMVTLPFVQDVHVVGLTPAAVAEQLRLRLKEFIVNPMVTVALEETRVFEVFVLGEVVHPGRYTVEGGATVLQAVAAGGGFTPYAGADRIFVLRNDPKPVRIRFRYEALAGMTGKSAGFRLKSGDVVLVE